MNNWQESKDPIDDLKKEIERIRGQQPRLDEIIIPKWLYNKLVADEKYDVLLLPPRYGMSSSFIPLEIREQLAKIIDDDSI